MAEGSNVQRPWQPGWVRAINYLDQAAERTARRIAQFAQEKTPPPIKSAASKAYKFIVATVVVLIAIILAAALIASCIQSNQSPCNGKSQAAGELCAQNQEGNG
jgi:hypothetical protein